MFLNKKSSKKIFKINSHNNYPKKYPIMKKLPIIEYKRPVVFKRKNLIKSKSRPIKIWLTKLIRQSNYKFSLMKSKTLINNSNTPFLVMTLNSSRKHKTQKRIWIKFIKCIKMLPVKRVSLRLISKLQKENLLGKKKRLLNLRRPYKHLVRNNKIIFQLLNSLNRNSLRYKINRFKYNS